MKTSLVEVMGLEPTNLLTASQALYQLSYTPDARRAALSGEPQRYQSRGASPPPVRGAPAADGMAATRVSPAWTR